SAPGRPAFAPRGRLTGASGASGIARYLRCCSHRGLPWHPRVGLSSCRRWQTRSPDLKFLAIAFALLSLLFAALAAGELSESSDASERREPSRTGPPGAIILLLVSSLSVAILWIGATELGWPRHRTVWVGVGALLAVVTLVRPWWFW